SGSTGRCFVWKAPVSGPVRMRGFISSSALTPAPLPHAGEGFKTGGDAHRLTLLPWGEGAQRADEEMQPLRRSPSPLPLSRRRERGSSNSGDAHGFYPSPLGRRCPAGG